MVNEKTLEVEPTEQVILAPETDPYIYGWRPVHLVTAEGEEAWQHIPLTRDDFIHPQVGDFRMHNEQHERFCAYLYDVLKAQFAPNPHTVVLHDVRVAWGDPDIKAHGPDIAVIFNVRERRNWSTFDVTEENTRPSLIIEITSPQVRSGDLIDKVEEYELVRVPCYIIVDSFRHRGRDINRLLGYHLNEENRYIPIRRNEHGRLWLEPVQLWLGFESDQLVLYNESGQAIDDYLNMTRARQQAEARAAEAEARLRELEEQLRRLQSGNQSS